MYHLVYKVTNTVNDRYYFGVHSTLNIDDGYMGSGNLIKKDIKHYGVEKFEREVLYSFECRNEALDKEHELVTLDVLKDPLCYNLIIGGNRGYATVPQRRELFSRNANPLIYGNGIPLDKLHPEIKYIFSRVNKTYLKSDGTDRFTETILRALNDGADKMLNVLTDLFNSKKTNYSASEQLKKLARFPLFQNNIDIKTERWEII